MVVLVHVVHKDETAVVGVEDAESPQGADSNHEGVLLEPDQVPEPLAQGQLLPTEAQVERQRQPLGIAVDAHLAVPEHSADLACL